MYPDISPLSSFRIEILSNLKDILDNHLIKEKNYVKVTEFHRLLLVFRDTQLQGIYNYVFENCSKKDYVEHFLIPSYHITNNSYTTRSPIHFAPLKNYLQKFNASEQEILEVLKNSSEEHFSKLRNELIKNNLSTLEMYEMKKISRTTTLGLILQHEKKLDYLNMFTSQIKEKFDKNHLKISQLPNLLTKYSEEKLEYLINNFFLEKERTIELIDMSFTGLTKKTTTHPAVLMLVEKILEKDAQIQYLDKNCFFLLTKRMAHGGLQNEVPKLFHHIKKYHDFHEEFIKTLFSGKKIEFTITKKYVFDLNNDSIIKQSKLWFEKYLHSELKNEQKLIKKSKI